MSDMKKQKPLVTNASNHSWNADQSQVCVASNGKSVTIYNTAGKPKDMSSWSKTKHVLNEHGGFVSGIDWCAKTNLIVTSGHDRNAYVWQYEAKDDAWIPALVILRINRAATSVKWSPDGQKFAVTSGAKCVPVCHFEEKNNWWISKMIKKPIKSTVLALDWSPNNQLIVTGSTDFKCRIFSAFVKETDTSDETYSWANKENFGACLAEFDQAKAWVQGVSWSPCGMQIVFTGHGSSTHFVEMSSDDPKGQVTTIFSKDLPHLDINFLDDGTAVATGFAMNPMRYEKKDEWEYKGKIDPESCGPSKKKKGAKNMWKEQDKKGISKGQEIKNTEVKTFHKNAIVDMEVLSDSQFTTCGLDGRILVWDL